jgi:hypothetical protein
MVFAAAMTCCIFPIFTLVVDINLWLHFLAVGVIVVVTWSCCCGCCSGDEYVLSLCFFLSLVFWWQVCLIHPFHCSKFIPCGIITIWRQAMGWCWVDVAVPNKSSFNMCVQYRVNIRWSRMFVAGDSTTVESATNKTWSVRCKNSCGCEASKCGGKVPPSRIYLGRKECFLHTEWRTISLGGNRWDKFHRKPKTPLHYPYTREQTESKGGLWEIWRV